MKKKGKTLSLYCWVKQVKSEKVTCCMIPAIWFSGKGRTIQQVMASVIPRGSGSTGGQEPRIDETQRVFRAFKLFCMVYSGGYVTCICQNSCNCTTWKVTLIWTVDLSNNNVSILGFPCGSAGKESACNSGDLGLISGLGWSPGEKKGYPLQYSGLENSRDCVSPWDRKELDTTERLSLFTFTFQYWLSCNRCIMLTHDVNSREYCERWAGGRSVTFHSVSL